MKKFDGSAEMHDTGSPGLASPQAMTVVVPDGSSTMTSTSLGSVAWNEGAEVHTYLSETHRKVAKAFVLLLLLDTNPTRMFRSGLCE